ncbi:MAG: hypothetical protein IPJ34_33410 [Myxococcales bacterium]|nr:hypothetical protein [Myxococcales bacterium]
MVDRSRVRFLQALAFVASAGCDRPSEPDKKIGPVRREAESASATASVSASASASATESATVVATASAPPSATVPKLVLGDCVCKGDPPVAALPRTCFAGERGHEGFVCSAGPACSCPLDPTASTLPVPPCPAAVDRCAHQPRPFVGVGPYPPPDLAA